MRLISQNSRARRWFWCGGIGLGLVLVTVVCVLLNANGGKPLLKDQPVRVESELSVVADSSLSNTIEPVVAIEELQLPALDFLPGSIEDACGLNEFPHYWAGDESLRSNLVPSNVLESENCWAALENHFSAMTPYLWGGQKDYQFAFVVLENPLTFGRIFADPAGDFARVQDALSRSECLLEPEEKNWELKESCHADAFLNYALISRFCFFDGVRNRSRTYYWPEDNPTPEQDRFMWKQRLEGEWVEMKCEELDPTLELTEYYPELHELVISLKNSENKIGFIATLIEQAARLGDEAAWLTDGSSPSYGIIYGEKGYKHGRFAELLTSAEWRAFEWKKQPTVDRFLQTFQMLARLDASRVDPRDEIEFDWEWTVRHLCEPPFENFAMKIVPEPEFMSPPETVLSCKEVVHKIRQQGISFLPLTLALDKFEQVALKLEVYE